MKDRLSLLGGRDSRPSLLHPLFQDSGKLNLETEQEGFPFRLRLSSRCTRPSDNRMRYSYIHSGKGGIRRQTSRTPESFTRQTGLAGIWLRKGKVRTVPPSKPRKDRLVKSSIVRGLRTPSLMTSILRWSRCNPLRTQSNFRAHSVQNSLGVVAFSYTSANGTYIQQNNE
jgi:hypothetical protein